MSNPFQDLKAGDTVHYWFRTKGRAKRIGKTRLGYRGAKKVKVASVGAGTLMLSDDTVFDRATGKASFKQEVQDGSGLDPAYHTIIPKRIIKPWKVKW